MRQVKIVDCWSILLSYAENEDSPDSPWNIFWWGRGQLTPFHVRLYSVESVNCIPHLIFLKVSDILKISVKVLATVPPPSASLETALTQWQVMITTFWYVVLLIYFQGCLIAYSSSSVVREPLCAAARNLQSSVVIIGLGNTLRPFQNPRHVDLEKLDDVYWKMCFCPKFAHTCFNFSMKTKMTKQPWGLVTQNSSASALNAGGAKRKTKMLLPRHLLFRSFSRYTKPDFVSNL